LQRFLFLRATSAPAAWRRLAQALGVNVTTARFSSEELADFLVEIEQHMKSMLIGSSEIYDAGRKIWSSSVEYAPRSPEVAWPLWLIWGALTDLVETQPARRSEAEGKMLQAAKEWLAVSNGDAVLRTAYLDRWVYEEMRYERKVQ
jgi:hypothetical protein